MKTIPLSKTTKFVVDNRGKTAPTVDRGIALIATNCVTNDHLYPPDKQEKATQTVLEQAEVLSAAWAV